MSRRERQRGQGLVEFTLVVPVILLIVVSVAELGLAHGNKHTIGYGSREGARVGSALAAGLVRLNVNTNLGQNANHGAENLFSIWTKGTGLARVYGGGRMAAYTNLDDTGAGGAQQFYFSQIDGVHAGKTMEITLFDPGEAGSDSYLRFLTPQGGTYHYATFDWASNDGRSGSGTEVQTAAPARFNNRLLTIQIALPTDYGDAGLDPDGLGEDGWWKVEYDVRAGNDTTTWEVKLIGNPVHLVLE